MQILNFCRRPSDLLSNKRFHTLKRCVIDAHVGKFGAHPKYSFILLQFNPPTTYPPTDDYYARRPLNGTLDYVK